VLGELLDVVSAGPAAENDSPVAEFDLQVLDPPAGLGRNSVGDGFGKRWCGATHLLAPMYGSARYPGGSARFVIASASISSVRWCDVNPVQTTDQKPASGLIPLAGPRPLFPDEIRTRVEAGARLVRFEFCLSALLFTIRRQSAIYLTTSWQERYLRGLRYSLVALFLGPWGVPWGLIWTPWAVWVNLTGGVDETKALLAWLDGCEIPTPGPARPDS
jgi:hypothetical protein